MRHPKNCTCRSCYIKLEHLRERLKKFKSLKHKKVTKVTEKTKSLKVGDTVIWDFSGDRRKGKPALVAGPFEIKSLSSKQATIVGPTLTGKGTYRKKVPLKELIEYQIELSKAEKLQGQFNLLPIPSPSELEKQTEKFLEKELRKIK